MQQSIDRIVREAGEWYTHGLIRHGYTHRGQVLGAGIGPGGNLQSMDISWVKELKRIGLQVLRYEHNADYYNASFANTGNSQWIDIGIAGGSDWTYRDFILNAKVQGIQSFNYQWNAGLEKGRVFNFHGSLGVTYVF
jgi:hypothetical protein